MQSLVATCLEAIWFLDRPEQILRYVQPSDESLARMRHFLDDARGVIVISPHVGNWEIGQVYMNATGCPTSAVGAKIKNPFAERLLTRSRISCGGELIPERGAAKGIFKALRDGRHVAMLVDQNTRPSEGGIFADFFGLPATVSRAPAMFARRAGAQILICACLRRTDGTFGPEMHPLPKDIDAYASDEAVLTEINRISEQIIRRHPNQYLWLYRRWRYIPNGLPPERVEAYPFYAKSIDQARGGAGKRGR